MSSVQIAMIAGLPYTALRDAILTHPTLAEGLGALFSSEPSAQNQRVQPTLATPSRSNLQALRQGGAQ